MKIFFRLLLVLFLMNSIYALSGNLLTSRKTSCLTYVYKITDKEAKIINKKGLLKADSTFLHTLVDSYPTDSVYKGILSSGHYLQVSGVENKQRIFYVFVPNFEVQVLNNNTDLYIQIYNLQGTIINNAKVKVGGRNLKFDAQTQCYLHRKSNLRGFLSVTYQGNTAYFDLKRKYNNSAFLRNSRKVLYGTPLQYVWRPVKFVVDLPVDAVKSISKGHLTGSLWRTKSFFRRVGYQIENLFYGDYSYRQNLDYKGYLVFNKPKYMPGDTVRLKAYLVNKKGTPLEKEVSLTLFCDSKNITLDKLKPYYPGAYEYSFYLHDSLNLKLDKYCTVFLENKKGENYISNNFRYEDYELNPVRLELRTDGSSQYRGKPFSVFLKGVDDNGLNVQDARMELQLLTDKVEMYLSDKLFVPDTIWSCNQPLKPVGETEILIPDSIFPKLNLTYKLQIRMLTSDNKTFSQSKVISYYSEIKSIFMNLKDDSVQVRYSENGMPKSIPVKIFAADNFGIKTDIGNFTTPCNLPLNVYYKSYTAVGRDMIQTLEVDNQSSLLQCFATRTKDSLFIETSNPRKLNFTYNIYKGNSEKFRGYGKSLSLRKSVSSSQNYYASIRYLWGGEIKEATYRIPLADKMLNVSVKQPKLIYPGMKSNVEITVTDPGGKPVEGVDLTAFSITSKFDYSVPDLPYLGKSRPEKSVINNFTIGKSLSTTENFRYLNYEAWKTLAGIDSIEYYKFLYPGDSIYRYDYKQAEGITQFAPFVVSERGDILPVHVIYVDNKPVYFSWTNVSQPYAFRVDDGKHQIQLRLRDKLITIDNYFFEKGYKSVFSISMAVKDNNIDIKKMPVNLTDIEKNVLNRYIFPYRDNFKDNFVTLEKDYDVQLLNSNYDKVKLAGPVSGLVNVNMIGTYSYDFLHEPYFEYEFSGSKIKMREVKPEWLPTNNPLAYFGAKKNLEDSVLTKKNAELLMMQSLELKRRMSNRYNYPTKTIEGYARIFFSVEDKFKDRIPLNTLIIGLNNEKFIRVYPGRVNMFHQLKEGFYQIILFYQGSSYCLVDSVYAKRDGITYIKTNLPESLSHDNFGKTVSNMIEQYMFLNKDGEPVKESELNQIYNQYLIKNIYNGEGSIISGKVVDATTKEPVIGASITVDGTNLGTVSNLEGNFTLKVPKNRSSVTISYVGYNPVKMNIWEVTNHNIELTESELNLNEVVVIGYGTYKKQALTGSISSVLSGKVSGVVGSQSSENLIVRGVSAISVNATPLYVVDGMVFTGNPDALDQSMINNIEVIKDESAIAIYGARAANGVVVISTKDNAYRSILSKDNKGADYDQSFVDAATQAGNLRTNFSDYAYWQPRLKTDKNGKVRFDVTFPDDVTKWNTYALAMNGKRQVGMANSSIKSYKPLMAQLSVPSFLVMGDTVKVIGKTVNYLPDSTKVKSSFEQDGAILYEKSRYCRNSDIDTLNVVAHSDTLRLKYMLKREDGYFDGEERQIPVFPTGMEETTGSFYMLDSDSTITPVFNHAQGEVSIYADADVLNVFETEIKRLKSYRYDCNEQIASKLIALLSERAVAAYKGVKFKYDRDVESMIQRLVKNRKSDGFWGWWPDTETHYRFSLHVLQALGKARQQNFKVNIDSTRLAMDYVSVLESGKHQNIDKDVCILKMLKMFNCAVDYKTYINELDTVKHKSFDIQLSLIELRQSCKIPYDTTLLSKHKQQTIFGNTFYREENKNHSLMSNDIMNTLSVYRILRHAGENDSVLNKIRRFFMETKQSYSWWNTYESAQILETILPDILKMKTSPGKSSLMFLGDINKTITEFPYTLKVNADQKITITKRGQGVVFLTAYQHAWNANPKPKSGDFVIETRFNSGNLCFYAGKPVKLIVNLELKKDAEYVMLNIPVPAGFSYENKNQGNRWNEYREYYKNMTNIYFQKLQKGKYTYEINLIPRFDGIFTLNPAKVELMYFPTFNANNSLKKVRVVKEKTKY